MKLLKELANLRRVQYKQLAVLVQRATLPQLSNSILPLRYISTGLSHQANTSTAEDEAGFFRRLKQKFGFLRFTKSQLRATGYQAYENVIEGIDYEKFLSGLKLPDTFYSWFLITELHVWLVMGRYMNEGSEGREVRNALVEAMWQDVEMRSKQLGEEVSASARREQVQLLVPQFQAALFSYDEGALSSDTVLAGAVWRGLFQQSPDVNFQHLEAVLEYVRAQAVMLESLTSKDLFNNTKIKWEPLKLH